MNTIQYESSEKTPEIRGDIAKGVIIIKGRSYPEGTVDFYKDFKIWFQEFYEKAPNEIHVVLDLEYFNTSTTAVVYEILQRLSQLQENHSIKIEWYFDEDDIDMIEKGNDLKRMVGDILDLKIRH